MLYKLVPRLRELAPAARGSQDAAFRQPRNDLLEHLCSSPREIAPYMKSCNFHVQSASSLASSDVLLAFLAASVVLQPSIFLKAFLGCNSIDKNGFGPVLGLVFRPKLGQASICFQVVHTCVLFNFAFRASFWANFRANIYFY